MNLGVIGPKTSVDIISKVARRDIPDVQLTIRTIEFYEYSWKLADQLQKSGSVDAILFSGPANYRHSLNRLKPTIPWRYIPHSRVTLMSALLKAIIQYHSDLNGLSLDSYEPELVSQVLAHIGHSNTQLYTPPFTPEDLNYEKKCRDFHRDCYNKGLVSICFTGVEHVQAPLLEENIPCIRFLPADELIREQIYHLRISVLSIRENKGHIAVIALQFNPKITSEGDLSLQEWQLMKLENHWHEIVSATAQQINAAVFFEGRSSVYFVTTRKMVMDVFLKDTICQQIFSPGNPNAAYRTWMGIGIGSTTLIAKSRARRAMAQAKRSQSGTTYLALDDTSVTKISYAPATGNPNQDLLYFSQKVHVSTQILQRLITIIKKEGPDMTSKELASYLGITIRSTDRIISHLYDAGCISIAGKTTTGKGRPARLLHILIPDRLLCQPD